MITAGAAFDRGAITVCRRAVSSPHIGVVKGHVGVARSASFSEMDRISSRRYTRRMTLLRRPVSLACCMVPDLETMLFVQQKFNDKDSGVILRVA